MENPIVISNINDFMFCPVSIYFHLLDEKTEKLMYQTKDQLNGTKVHESIDKHSYSDRTKILQGINVYSDKYNIIGKIDIFDIDNGILTERKNAITTIYDGYIFQIYAECLCLREMGYIVNSLKLYSMSTNTCFQIKKPEEDEIMFEKFKEILQLIENFDMNNFQQENIKKCQKCIYEDLCTFSLLDKDDRKY